MLSSPDLSEVTDVPSRARRWKDQVEEYVRRERDEFGSLGKLTTEHRRRDLRRWPTMCRRAGLDGDLASAADVTSEQILAVRRSEIWATTTLKPIFSGLRAFCRKCGNPELAAVETLWRLPRGTSDRRVWLTEEQLATVYAAARGRVRVRVALQGYLGMREDSVRSLRARELLLDGPVPRIHFAVKGPDGERLTIAVDQEIAEVLRSWTAQKGFSGDARIYPVSHCQADGDLRQLGKQIGLPFPLSGHVLRRSWARIAYYAAPTLEQLRGIQRILGHRQLETTWHYVGAEYVDMAAALGRFHERMRQVATAGA